ncbi:Gfo/Idh/MocA family protein [uncultured Jatrophihabitans sp.]|uniref:Gfo/Idh/MocA family protein n=1 Tax=uncultured Jatrophihabitans sp. TaxID=1610747 RepID=UPI0035C9CA38
MIRWGILGAGGIAGTVAPDIAATPGHAVHAVAARDADRAAAFAAAHGAARSYGSYAELVADPDVDVVYVATTHGQHHEHARLALHADKPVLVEKAFALNAGQARDIVALARERQLFCMEAMWTRLNPLIRTALDLVAGGRIGDVLGARTDLSRYFPYDPASRLFDLAAGGGALLDMGIYPVTVAWLFLGRPDTVAATGSLSPTGSDLTTALQWGYADGRIAQIYTSAAGTSPLAAVITGTEGWLAIEPRIHRPQRLLVHERAHGTNEGHTEEVSGPPAEGNGYRLEVAEVGRCLEAGLLESPFVPLDETVAILEVLDEARRQVDVRYPSEV